MATRDTAAPEAAPPRVVAKIDEGLSSIEYALYIGLSIVLIGGAAMLLVGTAFTIVKELDSGVETAITKSLDRLLLTFILVELLGAVRATIREHKLIAEPFLVVGMIAVIKEVVVVLLDVKDKVGKGALFDDSMSELAVLAGLLLALGLTIFLTRRKEREPEE